jgi:nucleoside-diphosphate-sugar epimerase
VRVFVTGGTGLVGRHVIPRLVARGDETVALARSDVAAAALARLGARVVRGDLLDGIEGEALEALRGSEAVVHAAATVISRHDWDHYRAANVEPTERLARIAAEREGRRFVHLSSVSVYGRRTVYDGGSGSVSEEFGLERPVFPGDHYARSKREAELALWRVMDETGLSVAALRPCVIYGEGDRHFTTRARRLVRRGWGPLIGGGGNPLGVVWAGNVAAAVLAALDRRAVTGPFNVTNDGVITQRRFLEVFARGLGVRLRLVPLPRGLAWAFAGAVDGLMRLADPSRPMAVIKLAVQFLASPNPYVSARAERELGWRPELDPESAVELTARSMRG